MASVLGCRAGFALGLDRRACWRPARLAL